jgi:hypothetical protein
LRSRQTSSIGLSSGACFGRSDSNAVGSTPSQGRAASAVVASLLVWIGPSPLRGRGVEHDGLQRPTGPRPVAAVDLLQEHDEVGAALGPGGVEEGLLGAGVERAPARRPSSAPRSIRSRREQGRERPWRGVGEVGVGKRLRRPDSSPRP